jgi:hypothetical protein
VVPAAASANSTNISTGYAYDVALTSGLLGGTLATVGPVVGPIASNTTTSHTASAVNLVTSLLNANVLSASVKTTNEGSVSTSQILGLETFIPLLPTIT